MFLSRIADYWDLRAKGYSKSIHEQLENEEFIYYNNLLKENAPKEKCLKCLDVGCGPGFFSILLAKQGHEVTAMDYSDGMLEEAKNNFEEAGVKVNVVKGDAQNPEFNNCSFDYIVSRNLAWNLEEPKSAYKEWYRMLKPGGRLLIADGNHYLYFYDKDYKSLHDERLMESGGKMHNCYGVDPTPINIIARNLPLSKQYRPQWDLEVLMELGAENIKINLMRSMAHKKHKNLVTRFVVCADKV